MRTLLLAVIALVLLVPSSSEASRLKDLVEIEGFRSNKLVGYGLVVGLSGTGDSGSSVLVKQSMANLLKRLGASRNRTASAKASMRRFETSV